MRADPKNPVLLERTFLSVMIDGEVDEAVKLAERVIQFDKTHRVARLVLGVRALKAKQYPGCAPAHRAIGARPDRGSDRDADHRVDAVWLQDTKGAIESIDRLAGPEWYAVFKDLHAGLISDVAGNRKEAGKRFEKVYKLDANALRAVEAYGRWTSRQVGKDEALKIYEAFDKVLPQHPLIVEAMSEIKDGEKLPPLVESPQAGAAEVLFGLGTIARPPGRRGSCARLSAARDLSGADPSARADVAR